MAERLRNKQSVRGTRIRIQEREDRMREARERRELWGERARAKARVEPANQFLGHQAQQLLGIHQEDGHDGPPTPPPRFLEH